MQQYRLASGRDAFYKGLVSLHDDGEKRTKGWIERKMAPAYDPAKEVGGRLVGWSSVRFDRPNAFSASHPPPALHFWCPHIAAKPCALRHRSTFGLRSFRHEGSTLATRSLACALFSFTMEPLPRHRVR